MLFCFDVNLSIMSSFIPIWRYICSQVQIYVMHTNLYCSFAWVIHIHAQQLRRSKKIVYLSSSIALCMLFMYNIYNNYYPDPDPCSSLLLNFFVLLSHRDSSLLTNRLFVLRVSISFINISRLLSYLCSAKANVFVLLWKLTSFIRVMSYL